MPDNDLMNEILKNISLTGAASEERKAVNPIIGAASNIINKSSGLPRIQSNVVNKFTLIVATPTIIQALSPFNIRCCVCKRVISYPCWYYSIRYTVNHFHYFICFDRSSPTKPATKCYRRG